MASCSGGHSRSRSRTPSRGLAGTAISRGAPTVSVRASAALTGSPRGPTSILSTPITAEVAALYFISYLYYQKWDHASLVVLIDRDDSREIESSDENVKKAYGYYREWFERVKAIGIVKARELKIEPLKGKDVRWR